MKPFKKSALIGALLATGFVAPNAQAASNTLDCDAKYSVVRGDTLSGISLRAYGSPLYQPIYTANVDTIGTNPDMIYVDQSLMIPCLTSAGAIQAATETKPVPAITVDVTAKDGDTHAENADAPLVFTFNKASAPPFIINSGIIDAYLAEIGEVTEGRVTFVDPEVVNRDHGAQFELVTSGTVDGAYVLNSTIAASHPLLQLSMQPTFGGSAEQTAVSLWRLHEEYLSKTDYFSEAELLGFVAAPAAHIWREDSAPVTSTENIGQKNMYAVPYFSGLDTRGPAVMRAALAESAAAHNAQSDDPATYFMAHGAAVALGVWDDASTVSVTEVDTGLYTPSFSVVLSNDAWAQISASDQAAIREISGEALSRRSAAWDGFDNAFRAHMLDAGLKTTKADKALLNSLWVSSLQDVTDWRKDAEALGIPSYEALNYYLGSLRSLENRLIYRGDETYVDQNPFVTGGN